MEPLTLAIALGAIIGAMLALTGAGGGVLAIPLLVFGLHLPVQQAAPVGLVAVGLAAALGAALGLRQRIVRYRAAGLIGVAGMLVAPLGVFMAQRLPNRPLLAAFALVLIYTAWRMLKRPPPSRQSPVAVPCHVSHADQRLTWTLPCARALAGTGLISGLLSGLLGVGGGFVIVPALTRYTDLDMRSVQVTSLAVIALVSLSGVSAAAWHGSLPWAVALPFALGAVLALLLGRQLAGKLNAARLQQAFAWFSLGVAALMLARAAGWVVS
ncbi:MAG: sulfite exporter TauE/SafE family protein [Rhodoferax sp.]|uniref:sulfite exporter TauE/SafE family protein n=1 Tax=Rhodoferax sp. TaxID=50421 RepID=UPI0017B6F58B|nr:sulfite exporter TauE/SafE family protein [Rhodoferax sp.]NMM18677.1 sulfite exporter TauE/SafE family protein [Rhodoferax sp.]